jgi:single-strand DNA-binding protein
MNINLVIVAGNLTRDPERKALPNGGTVTTLGIATNRQFKKADGEKGEQTEFHNIVVFGKQADSCAQHLTKGAIALVEGRLQTRSWDKDGVKQYRTEIVADRVQFGPRPAGETPAMAAGEGAEPIGAIEHPAEDINPDDIPF